MLPHPDTRRCIGPNDSQTGQLAEQLASPSADLNFEALQAAYSPTKESKVDPQSLDPREVVARVKLMLDDGRLLAERVMRASKERGLLKSNALRAQRLAEDSSNSMRIYQK